ncbi:hypothetical protein VTN96DRAFT_9081 [Rasamsonia emersonii]
MKDVGVDSAESQSRRDKELLYQVMRNVTSSFSCFLRAPSLAASLPSLPDVEKMNVQVTTPVFNISASSSDHHEYIHECLMASSSSNEEQSLNLVVCGANDHKHGFVFSNFMSICVALREHSVGGRFYSFGSGMRIIPQTIVIKFGKFGPDNSKSFYTYCQLYDTTHDRRKLPTLLSLPILSKIRVSNPETTN